MQHRGCSRRREIGGGGETHTQILVAVIQIGLLLTKHALGIKQILFNVPQIKQVRKTPRMCVSGTFILLVSCLPPPFMCTDKRTDHSLFWNALKNNSSLVLPFAFFHWCASWKAQTGRTLLLWIEQRTVLRKRRFLWVLSEHKCCASDFGLWHCK